MVPPLDEENTHPAELEVSVRRYHTQTREQLLKAFACWKAQQKIVSLEVRKETGRWKSRCKIHDLLASAWSCLWGTVRTCPRPAGSPAFLAPPWSRQGRPAGRENEGDLMRLTVSWAACGFPGFRIQLNHYWKFSASTTTTDIKLFKH